MMSHHPKCLRCASWLWACCASETEVPLVSGGPDGHSTPRIGCNLAILAEFYWISGFLRTCNPARCLGQFLFGNLNKSLWQWSSCPKPWICAAGHRPLLHMVQGTSKSQVTTVMKDPADICGRSTLIYVDSTSASGFVSFLQPDALSAARKLR